MRNLFITSTHFVQAFGCLYMYVLKGAWNKYVRATDSTLQTSKSVVKGLGGIELKPESFVCGAGGVKYYAFLSKSAKV